MFGYGRQLPRPVTAVSDVTDSTGVVIKATEAKLPLVYRLTAFVLGDRLAIDDQRDLISLQSQQVPIPIVFIQRDFVGKCHRIVLLNLYQIQTFVQRANLDSVRTNDQHVGPQRQVALGRARLVKRFELELTVFQERSVIGQGCGLGIRCSIRTRLLDLHTRQFVSSLFPS